MSMNKASAKTFLKTLSSFKILSEMVKKAVNPTSPTLVKTHPKNRENMDVAFLELCHDWSVFKADLGVSEESFNSVEDGVPKYQYIVINHHSNLTDFLNHFLSWVPFISG